MNNMNGLGPKETTECNRQVPYIYDPPMDYIPQVIGRGVRNEFCKGLGFSGKIDLYFDNGIITSYVQYSKDFDNDDDSHVGSQVNNSNNFKSGKCLKNYLNC